MENETSYRSRMSDLSPYADGRKLEYTFEERDGHRQQQEHSMVLFFGAGNFIQQADQLARFVLVEFARDHVDS